MVQLVSRPATVARDLSVASFLVALLLPSRGLIEQLEPRFAAQAATMATGRNDPDRIPRGSPRDLASRMDAELFRDRLGHRDLKLACHLGHNPYSSKDGILVQRCSGVTGTAKAEFPV